MHGHRRVFPWRFNEYSSRTTDVLAMVNNKVPLILLLIYPYTVPWMRCVLLSCHLILNVSTNSCLSQSRNDAPEYSPPLWYCLSYAQSHRGRNSPSLLRTSRNFSISRNTTWRASILGEHWEYHGCAPRGKHVWVQHWFDMTKDSHIIVRPQSLFYSHTLLNHI